MPRSVKTSYNGGSFSSSKQSTGAYIIRTVTRRTFCLSVVLFLCTFSFLISWTQFSLRAEIAKPEGSNTILRIQSPRFFPIRYEREVLWMNERDQSLNHLNTSHIKDQGLRTRQKNKSKKNLVKTEKNEKLDFSNKITNGNTVKQNNEEALIENSTNVRFKVDENTVENQKEQITDHGNGSIQALLDKNVESQGAESRRYEDYGDMEGAKPEKDYYSKPDPARLKLIRNVERFHKAKKHSYYYRQPIPKLPEQKKGIVILTNYRSGSTFLGELFNQHPDAFYIFEPLYPFTGDCIYQRQFKVNLIQRLLKCDFPSMTELYGQITGPMRKNHVDILCLVDDFCFRKNTKELCHGELCPMATKKSKYCRGCGPLHLPRAMNVCRKKKLTVVKAIRLCNILDLKSLLTNPNMDIKVIHLVRDPRGIQSSRSKIHENWSMGENAQMTCDRLLFNGLNGLGNETENSWLKGRYMRMRYEDLSLKPLVMAQKIYDYAGLELLPEVHSWIKSNTRAKPTKSKVNPYATKRDSAVAMQAWRTHLTFKQVLTVQNVCSKMMHFFGYKTVSSQNDLLNLDQRLLL